MIGSKKGQAGAAVLVALVAVLIIMYVLFLPPAERATLLGEGQDGTVNGVPTTNILFSSPVGRVYLPSQPGLDHGLPAMGVRTVESGDILASADQITITNNVFEKAPAAFLFSADPRLTRNVILSFNLAAKTGGNVIIGMNGQTIFDQEVKSRTVQPITLTNIQNNNNLTFSTSSVGFAFWRTNRITLSDVKVTADVTDVSAAAARQTFSITKEEYALLEKAQLQFVPVCNREGKLTIMLNGAELFNGVPDCNNMNTLEIAPSKLQPEENTISFSTPDGDFIVDRGTVHTEGQKQQNRVFHFPIDPVVAQGKPLTVRVLFADAVDKQGTLIINNNKIPFRAQDIVEIPITNYARAGDNSIAFEATGKDFEVVKFDVLTQ